jgi:hypothetical protein
MSDTITKCPLGKGSYNGYTNWGCRCAECLVARDKHYKEYYAKHREEILAKSAARKLKKRLIREAFRRRMSRKSWTRNTYIAAGCVIPS